MQDLNATMFFKAKFTVQANDPNGYDLLWNLVSIIRQWITRKYNRNGSTVISRDIKKWTAFKFCGRFFDEENKNRVYAESACHVSSKDSQFISWACRITENQQQAEGFAPREWVTEIGYQLSEPGCADISYLVTFSDLAGFIGFCSEVPPINVPNVIKMLLKDKNIRCFIGSACISLDPIELKVGDFPQFYAFLLSPDRKVPVLYVSPRIEGGEQKMLVSPKRLAESVAGNAIVYYSTGAEFTDEMMYMGDNRYTCSGGAIRLYRPGINLQENGDQYRHRFLTAAFILEHTEGDILNIFRRALAQDVHFYEQLFRLENCRALIDADDRSKRVSHLLESKDTEVTAAMQLATEAAEGYESAKHDLQDANDQNDRLKNEIYGLESRIGSMQEQVERTETLESALSSIRKIESYPNNATAIAEYFEQVFGDHIVFTDRAYKSLKECSLKPDYLWEILYYMSTTLYDLLKQNHPQVEKEFKRLTGWDCSRGEGSMTRKDAKLMRQYEDEFNGKKIWIEAHVKSGVKESDPRFVRIHYDYVPEVADKLIIGHCGKHLDNYSTRKAK